jgi:hypothetical protein
MTRLITALALATALAACTGEDTTPVQTVTVADSADNVFFGMEMTLVDGGIRRAFVRADSAYFYDARRMVLHEVYVDFYTTTGVKEGVLTAKRANYNRITEAMEAFGDVKLVGLDGRRLSSPHLRYEKAANQIAGDSAFIAQLPDKTIEGIGFRSDPAMTVISSDNITKITAGNVTLPGR